MKFFNVYCCIFLLGAFIYKLNAQSGYYGTYFTQTASPANVAPDGGTLLNNDSLNGDSAKICIFSPVFGSETPYDFYNMVNYGISYYSPQWGIYQENGDSVPFNAQFNVLVPNMNGTAFIYTADSANIIDSTYAVIDDSAINNNPNALLFFSHNYNSYNDSGNFCDHTIGVFYNSAIGMWTLYNDDSVSAFIPNTQFNIFAVDPGPNAFLQVADTTNTAYYITYINNTFLNGNPNATLFVTYNLNAAGYNGYNQSQIETWYDETEGQWAIYNVQSYDSVYAGSAFNVFIADVVPTGIISPANEDNWTLYPNPAGSFSNLKYELNEAAQVKTDLLNSEGQEITNILNSPKPPGNYSERIPLSSLATGIYFCKFSVDGKVSIKPIVKQ